MWEELKGPKREENSSRNPKLKAVLPSLPFTLISSFEMQYLYSCVSCLFMFLSFFLSFLLFPSHSCHPSHVEDTKNNNWSKRDVLPLLLTNDVCVQPLLLLHLFPYSSVSFFFSKESTSNLNLASGQDLPSLLISFLYLLSSSPAVVVDDHGDEQEHKKNERRERSLFLTKSRIRIRIRKRRDGWTS